MKIIIDTDPGHDDAMALMLACKSPELEVLAVTTVAGNSTIENTTRNARFILNFIGRKDIPLFSGANEPLARPLVQAVVHGESGLDGVDLENTESNITNNAVKELLKLVKENPGEITIVTLGPLTNIAAAIRREPETMRKVKAIVSMGGAIEVAGNQNRVAEFNMFVDPEAAAIVADFPIEKVLVPLDACNDIHIQLDDIAKLRNKPLRNLLTAMLTPYIRNLAQDIGVKAALLYDPLTVFYLLEPDACTAILMDVRVEAKGVLTRGMTVADRRKISSEKSTNMSVLTHIDGERFIRRFLETIDQSESNNYS